MRYPTSVDTATAANGWRPIQPPFTPTTSAWSQYLDSLQRRIRGMHGLWIEALATMNAEQVNHFERAGVLPIAFTLNHMPRMEDFARAILSSGTMIWTDEGWAERTGIAVDDIGKDTTVAEMELQRIGDYPAFVEYAHYVFSATENWLDELDPDALGEVMFGGVYPPSALNAYIHRVVRDEKILRVDAIECWIYQHGIRHLGELEHARALVGLGGLTS
ncbi:MAG: hypothetical protein EXQ69_07725 [Acidimicrobiia bacterium]|nr:hypothetical protein [Acidimicrobiia bacterium]